MDGWTDGLMDGWMDATDAQHQEVAAQLQNPAIHVPLLHSPPPPLLSSTYGQQPLLRGPATQVPLLHSPASQLLQPHLSTQHSCPCSTKRDGAASMEQHTWLQLHVAHAACETSTSVAVATCQDMHNGCSRPCRPRKRQRAVQHRVFGT